MFTVAKYININLCIVFCCEFSLSLAQKNRSLHWRIKATYFVVRSTDDARGQSELVWRQPQPQVHGLSMDFENRSNTGGICTM